MGSELVVGIFWYCGRRYKAAGPIRLRSGQALRLRCASLRMTLLFYPSMTSSERLVFYLVHRRILHSSRSAELQVIDLLEHKVC